MTSTMNRRAILAGAASTAAASPALAIPVGPHPDAELISLGEQKGASPLLLGGREILA